MKCIIRNIPVYYETYGTGTPIIMLHGYTPDHRLMTGCMEPVFAQRPGWQRIYLDLPGMGRTPASDQIQGIDDMLDLVVAFIDAVIPGQQFLIAGESYGGNLSRGVVQRKFAQVMGMALICPAVVSAYEQRDLPAHTVIAANPQFIASLDPADAEEFEPMAVVQDSYNWERFRDEILCGLRVADQAFLERLRPRNTYTFDVSKLAQPFTRPVLIFTGRQDTAVGYRDAWNILEQYPRGTFAVLDRAGHNAHIEQSQIFNAMIHEWLDRVQETL